MDFMSDKPDKYYDVAIVDPEYGRFQHGGVNRNKFANQKNGTKSFVRGNAYKNLNWDKKPASREYFNEVFRVSKHQIIWGCNYYGIDFGKGRIIWDKCNLGTYQSDCEIAYNSLTTRVDLFRFMWRGMLQGKSIKEGHIAQGNKKLQDKRIHPTQKPVALYKWILSNYIPKEWKILETHRGSGSIGIACFELGYSIDACENLSEYHIDSCKWLQQKINHFELNPTLF